MREKQSNFIDFYPKMRSWRGPGRVSERFSPLLEALRLPDDAPGEGSGEVKTLFWAGPRGLRKWKMVQIQSENQISEVGGSRRGPQGVDLAPQGSFWGPRNLMRQFPPIWT